MLAIFEKELAHPPQELNSPVSLIKQLASSSSSTSSTTNKKLLLPKHPQETLKEFMSLHNNSVLSMSFGSMASLAYARPADQHHYSLHHHQQSSSRLFCGLDDIYCIFMGSLNNLCSLKKQYGLVSKGGIDEAMFVIEAYRTLRDRGPYPADQVVKEFEGSFAFVIYDNKAKTVFIALGSDGKVKLFWGIGSDGSIVISDDLEVIKGSCAKSFAPFPTGCMFHSGGGGLMSYEHPINKMKAMPRVDSEGVMCGANFKVDAYSRINSMPRVGSEANWSPLENYSSH